MCVAAITIIGAIILSLVVGQGGSRVAARKGTSEDSVISRDDDKYWKLGMFYYNKEDPTLFIEKRFGIGWTNNWARPMSWVFIVGLLVLTACFLVLTFWLTK